MENHKFQGKHLLAELYDIDDKLINDSELMKNTLIDGIKKSNSTLISINLDLFEPQGFTIFATLAESHTSIHTYPENNSLFFDAFTCGDADPNVILDTLISILEPNLTKRKIIKRGV